MSILTISAELPNIDAAIKRINQAGGMNGGLPYTTEAIRESTNLIQRTWIAYAQGAQVTYSGGTFRINTVTGQYVRSIQEGLRFPDDMTGEVVSTSPHGERIEDGQRAWDMKPKLLASPKAKTNKDGKRYITVAFRHGAPGTKTMPAMPQSVYNQAKKLGYSRRNGNVLGGIVKYSWGDKMGANAQGQRSHTGDHPGAGYTWKTGLYTGMVRGGQPGHSQYLTFRRLSENSDSKAWMHPAVKPRPVREAVMENTRDEILQLVRNGFEMDLYFMGMGGG